jgi:hypothetical protein
MQGREVSSKKETKKLEKRKSNEGRVQERTQEVQISMQREEEEKKRMEEEMKMKGIKTEEEVWRYINRERKKKGEIVSDRILWRNGESTSVSCWGVRKTDKKRKRDNTEWEK